MITTTIQAQFPYPSFPYRLEFGEGKNSTVCYFQCKEHLDTYLKRYKLKKKDIKIDVNKKLQEKNNDN